jgi:hypothetical protein
LSSFSLWTWPSVWPFEQSVHYTQWNGSSR